MFLGWRQLFLAFAALLFLSAAAIPVLAADAETRAFNQAQKQYDDGFYALAEKSLAEFVSKYSASPRVAQAVLLEAKAALAQKDFQAALALLTTNVANAAGIADQFQLAIARSYFTNGNLEAAAQNYAHLIAIYTNSSLRLPATIEEAVARTKLKQWPRIISLLQDPSGVFQKAIASAPDSDAAVEGRLLLAEALIEQRRFADAEKTVDSIPENAVLGKSKWRREHLRAKAQFAAQKLETALSTASNLVGIAVTARQPALEAAGIALQGEILEALNQPEAAIAAYELNQRPEIPPDRAREALFKIVELKVEQGQLTNALARLQSFVIGHPSENGSDIALLSLAELRLKQYQFTTGGTNGLVPATADLLFQTIADCERVPTNSPFASKAQFVRAWALLAQGKATESLLAFRNAADTLTWSEPQAVARFKAADLAFQSDQFTNALRDYRRVLSEYESLPRVQSELVPRARYQMLQASIAARDVASAEEVVRAILREYPVNDYAERSLLLFGQALDELGSPGAARNVFSNFTVRFPMSLLRPEVELAAARSYEREHDWSSAVSKYDAWVTVFPTNENLPSAEFRRAMANFHAGRDTNALTLFTNFVVRFPTNPFAERAQEKVGDFYFEREEFEMAERNYQLVYQDRPTTPVSWRAKLKAGRAALLRPSFANATNYFANLINAEHCPTSIVVQAYFAYGEAYLQRPITNVQENFKEALKIYRQVPQFFGDDPLVPRAWGQMAICHFQLEEYDKARELYEKIMAEPAADLSSRQQAQVGIGHVQRAQARLARAAGSTVEAAALTDAALKNYLDVFYAEPAGEAPDPFWVREAALRAAEISESQRNWERALAIYVRLSEKIPVLHDALARKTALARERLQKQ
ncbi:MAG TPA: tetratricopeptide repeat protein [Candidatus Limnocylindria bacterium]|nr:tetratricopeptide repeat protein [Candidatus Limnocylindria bacterium]